MQKKHENETKHKTTDLWTEIESVPWKLLRLR